MLYTSLIGAIVPPVLVHSVSGLSVITPGGRCVLTPQDS